MTWKAAALVSFIISVAASANAQPEHSETVVGMAHQRLQRASRILHRAVDEAVVGGAVGLVARDGKIVLHESAGAMRADAIARLASITKAVTAVTILSLYEDGKLRLEDPVARFLPEFESVRVAAPGIDGGPPRLVQPARPITIYDLLVHQSGLAVSGDAFEKAYFEIDSPGGQGTVQDLAAKLAGIPLTASPGDEFEYGWTGAGYEVLAAVAERATGQRFDEVVQQRVLIPLQMNNTHFHVPESQRGRLAAVYKKNAEGRLVIHRQRGEEEVPNRFLSGAGGLRSSVPDYYRFAQMLLNGGVMDGRRILSPKTVQLMTRNHVGDAFTGPEGDYGWGFGFAVRTRVRRAGLGSEGSYGWNGGTGTLFLIDPLERLIVIIFAPSQPRTPGVAQLRDDFVTAAFQAIEIAYAAVPSQSDQ